jgi:hypothetical protein
MNIDGIYHKPVHSKHSHKILLVSYHVAKKTIFRPIFIASLIVLSLALYLAPFRSEAVYSQDDINGLYTDNFADATGLSNYQGQADTSRGMSSTTYAKVDTTAGVVKLTNSSGNFTAPYQTSGYVITRTIMPQSVVEWDTISLVTDKPTNTSIKVQVMDDYDKLFTDEQLPGNSTGFTGSSIDISSLAVLQVANQPYTSGADPKPLRLRLKFSLETTDTSTTPTIDSLSFSWKPKADTLPSPSVIDDIGWPLTVFGYDQKRGVQTPDYNSNIYSTLKWKSETSAKTNMSFTSSLHGDNFITTFWGAPGSRATLKNFDRKTGEKNCQVPYATWGYNVIDKNGTAYSAEHGSDLLVAVDTNTCELKWTYAFGQGHGNCQVLIGLDGTLFTIVRQNLSVGQPITLYAFNSNGTIKYTVNFPANPGENLTMGSMAMADDGTIYFGTSTDNGAPNYTSMNHGALFSIDPSDGSTNWSYNTGDIASNPYIDGEGNIYVGQYNDGSAESIKIYALTPGGSLIWERTIAPVTDGFGWSDVWQRGTELITSRYDLDWNYVWERVNMTNGSVTATIPIEYGDPNFFDGVNGGYWTRYSNGEMKFSYRDSNYSEKWKLFYPASYTEGDISVYYNLGRFSMDEDGWLYSSFAKTVYNSTLEDPYVYDEQFAYSYALAPWTISSSVTNAGSLKAGATAHFQVTTSMLETNFISGGSNKMQIVMEGVKIPLTYSSTSGEGDTVWTADYVLPEGFSSAASYTVEASADNMETDIPVHFDTPATNSNNTGYILETNFIVDSTPPTFNNLSETDSPINLVDGQAITTNPYIIRVKPTDNVEVDRVEFFVDNTKIGTDYEADSEGIYEYSWDTARYHSDIRVIAYDVNGNQSVALERSVNVDPALYATELPDTGIPWALYPVVACLPFAFLYLPRRYFVRRP